MDIRCKNCHYEYDYGVYGEQCPKCHFENKPFRSQSARRLMGYEDDSLRSYRFNNNRAERREELLRSGDADYGKSPLRRVRRYLAIIALCFAVLMLGQAVTRLSHLSAPEEPVDKPPVSELASAGFHRAFEPMGGINLQVRYTGVLPDENWSRRREGVKCVFVDVAASLEGEAPDSFPGAIFIRVGETAYPAQTPKADGVNVSRYTAFPFGELRRNGYAAGQFFFYLPQDTEEFDLCWRDERNDIEQRLPLHL